MSIDRTSNEYSNQEIIKKLRAIIDLEESKPLAERDVDLITECVDYLMELEQGVELTQEELEKEKQKIYAYNKNLNKPAKRLKFKGLLVAACFVILMLLANFVAIACGVDTISILKEWGHRIVEMFEGEEAEYKGYTIIKQGEIVNFDSVDDFENNTQINILYPTVFPQNIELKTITLVGSYDESNNYTSDYYTVSFITNNPNISVIVHTNPSYIKSFITNESLSFVDINGYECYIDNVNQNIHATFVCQDNTYIVKSNSLDELKLIVSNLKESS